MTWAAQDRHDRILGGLVALAVVATLAATEAAAQTREGGFLGLTAGSANAPIFWEGRTNYRLFVRPKGVVRAVMLFARFPDAEAEAEESTQDLFNRLVPEGVAFFERASYGEMTLRVDARHRWVPMDEPSTSARYDGSKWETHKAYIAEVVGKTGKDVDFSKYEIVYIVGSKNRGTPKSPTWRAWPGDGVRAGAAEVRHAVTFGNDARNANWGWQTLAHETGHVFGLPDLYSFTPGPGPYKNLHKHVGFWDLMSWQAAGSEYLAWHKYKLGWLSDRNFVVAKTGPRSGLVTPIDEKEGVKAVVVPVRNAEAYVVEVRSRDGKPGSETGVLCYKVSLSLGTGEGPIQVIPARPDDGTPELEKKFVTLYNALHFQGTVLEDAGRRVKIEILGREGRAYRIGVTR
jgi:M6 family metalloprotease-like protein